MDGKVRARKAVSGLQTERKFVQPYLPRWLPPHSLDSTERPESLPGSLLSPSEGSPSTPRALYVQLGAAGERSSRPAELHRQCSVLCRPSESVDSWEAAAAACQPRRSRPRPAAVRTRASSWEERICAGSHPHRTRAIQVLPEERWMRQEPP